MVSILRTVVSFAGCAAAVAGVVVLWGAGAGLVAGGVLAVAAAELGGGG